MKEKLVVFRNNVVQFALFLKEEESGLVGIIHLFSRPHHQTHLINAINDFKEKWIDYTNLEEKLVSVAKNDLKIDVRVLKADYDVENNNITWKLNDILNTLKYHVDETFVRVKVR